MVAFGNLVGLLLAAEAAVARSRRHGKDEKHNQFSYDNSSWWNGKVDLEARALLIADGA